MGGDDVPTGATPTVAAAQPPHAYEFEEPEPELPARRGWVVAVSALVLAVAGVVGAVVAGVHTWTTDPPPTPVAAPDPPPYRDPALTHPDQDTAFLQELDRTGTIYDTAGTAIHNARLVCKMLAAGKSEDEITAGFARVMELPDPAQSRVFVTLSVKHYCVSTPPV